MQNRTDAEESVQLPTLNFRAVVRGMLTLNVVNGLIVAVLVSASPLVLLCVAAISDSSIPKAPILFVLATLVVVSLGANIIQIGMFCVTNFYSSVERRILVTLIVTAWLLFLFSNNLAGYLDLILVFAAIAIAVLDKVYPTTEIN